MKNSTFLRSLLTLLVMVVWGGVMAQSYEKVTDASQLIIGDKYLIVNETNKKTIGSQNSNNRAAIDVTINNNAIDSNSLSSEVAVIILGGTTNNYTLKVESSGKFLYAASTSKNYLRETTDTDKANAQATITFESNGDATIKFNQSARNWIRYNLNNGTPIFSCYTSGQEAVQLYHYVASATPTAAAPTFTPDGGTVEKGSTISLACGTEGATIYYAIDAADPETAVGTAYTTPITINEDCSITAWAEADGMDASARVTKEFTAATYIDFQKANNVISGQKYLMYANGKVAIPYTGDNTYAYMPVEEVALTDGVIKQLTEDNTLIFTAVEGGYTIQNSKGDYYHSTADHNTISFVSEASGDDIWTVESDEEGFKITNTVSGKYLQFSNQYNSYGSYSTAQTNAVLPMLYTNGDPGVAVTKQEQTLTFSGTTFTIEEGESFTAPILTGAMTTVTYRSSETTVATVDENTGEVTIKGAGTTTITATAAANEEYKSAEASYTLTVNPNIAGVSLPYMLETKIGDTDFGGKANLPSGATPTGLGNDYGAGATAAPNSRLKFDSAGDNLVFKLADSPATLSYIIKSNSFAGGTFTVETSVDGSSYTTLKTYNTAVFDEAGSDIINEIHLPLNADVRYIRWTYTNKVSGNIGLGSIYITKQGDATTMPLSISAAKYATFFSDKAIVMPEGVSGNIVTIDGAQANLTEEYVAGDIVPANTPLLLSAEAGTYNAPFTAATNTQNAENLLKGALTNDVITAPANTLLYIFANDSESGLGFYWQKDSGNGQQVKNMAGKAYLQVPTTSPVQGFRLNLGDTTGITAVESTNANAPVYTLSGVRVNGSLNNLPAGIYIVGGKKVYVK